MFSGLFMRDISQEDQEKISRFVELSLSLILKGFDEMEMKKRLELIKLLGHIINLGFEKIYGRMKELEKRMENLENNNDKINCSNLTNPGRF